MLLPDLHPFKHNVIVALTFAVYQWVEDYNYELSLAQDDGNAVDLPRISTNEMDDFVEFN